MSRLGLVVAACIAATACGGGKAARPPRPMLASSVAAQREFQKILKDWARADDAGRVELEARLVRFQESHPEDELVRAADMLITYLELVRGDLQGAERHAFTIQVAGPGEVSDLAQMIQGASLRRQGKPEQALGLLKKLEGKLIDGWARAFLNQELVAAAVAAREWREAVHFVAVWLREADPDQHDWVKQRIVEIVRVIPTPELVKALERGKRLADAGLPDHEAEVRTLFARRVGDVAKANKDAGLAQQLLEMSGALLGEHGDSVAALASGAGKARVEPRTVGLLLSLRTDEARRRGVDMASGVAFGLGLPGGAARLVSRDDGGALDGVDTAMAELAADGASIVIGGSDEAEAARMARFADKNKIPVVLARSPGSSEASPFVYVIGEDVAEVDRALAASLASRGAHPLAVVADPDTPLAPGADMTVRRCGDLGAPWSGVQGLVLGAGEACAREALGGLTSLRVHIAAGFDAQGIPLPTGTLRASAGLFPADSASPPPALEKWVDSHNGPPSWFAALGRDAAVLAYAGVQALPPRGTEDPREVTTYRVGAAAALAAAQADLWTSEARGFGGKHVLPRSVSVREREPTPRSRPRK